MFHRRQFRFRKKRGQAVGKTKRGKGTKIMAIADSHGLPLSICTTSASPAECKLVEHALQQRFLSSKPRMLIGDKAYHSDPLDESLMRIGVELIAPHKHNRIKAKTQDGRKLRRYKKRWKLERLFAWLQNYRRIIVSHEFKYQNYHAFVQIACILLKNIFIG